jgi:hypothetical protein
MLQLKNVKREDWWVLLKVVGNEKVGGSEMCQSVQFGKDRGDRGFFAFLFCCRLWFYIFPFPPQ